MLCSCRYFYPFKAFQYLGLIAGGEPLAIRGTTETSDITLWQKKKKGTDQWPPWMVLNVAQNVPASTNGHTVKDEMRRMSPMRDEYLQLAKRMQESVKSADGLQELQVEACDGASWCPSSPPQP